MFLRHISNIQGVQFAVTKISVFINKSEKIGFSNTFFHASYTGVIWFITLDRENYTLSYDI